MNYETVAKDEKIVFGQYEWRVLDKLPHKVLLHSDRVIGGRPYHNDDVPVTWEDSDIRKYLNDDFFALFSQEEQSRIIPSHINNGVNPHFGKLSGEAPLLGGEITTDKIFLLSIEEVEKYRPRNDGCWWLRSAGFDTYLCASYVSRYGDVMVSGGSVFYKLGLRPALWLNVA